ncbi:probable serine/threonine-protein kinase mkcC isoform X2 [Gordionus sp. m RMFG-2023]
MDDKLIIKQNERPKIKFDNKPSSLQFKKAQINTNESSISDQDRIFQKSQIYVREKLRKFLYKTIRNALKHNKDAHLSKSDIKNIAIKPENINSNVNNLDFDVESQIYKLNGVVSLSSSKESTTNSNISKQNIMQTDILNEISSSNTNMPENDGIVPEPDKDEGAFTDHQNSKPINIDDMQINGKVYGKLPNKLHTIDEDLFNIFPVPNDSVKNGFLDREKLYSRLKCIIPPRHRYVPTVKVTNFCCHCQKPMWIGLKCKICKIKCHSKCAENLTKFCSIESIMLNNTDPTRNWSLFSFINNNSILPHSNTNNSIPKNSSYVFMKELTQCDLRKSASSSCILPFLLGQHHNQSSFSKRERRRSKDDIEVSYNDIPIKSPTPLDINRVICPEISSSLSTTSSQISSSPPPSSTFPSSAAVYSLYSQSQFKDKNKAPPSVSIFNYYTSSDNCNQTSVNYPETPSDYYNFSPTSLALKTTSTKAFKDQFDLLNTSVISQESSLEERLLSPQSGNTSGENGYIKDKDRKIKNLKHHWTKSFPSSLKEWNIPFDQIEIGEPIGTGWQAKVYRGYWHGKVAIKILNVDESYLDLSPSKKSIINKSEEESNDVSDFKKDTNLSNATKNTNNKDENTLENLSYKFGDNINGASPHIPRNPEYDYKNSENSRVHKNIFHQKLSDHLKENGIKFDNKPVVDLEKMLMYRKYLESFRHEISVLRKTRHQNLVLFMGACIKPPIFAIITSLCKGISLYKHIHAYGNKFTLEKIIYIATQISQGMGYLHAKGIIHKDLRSKNVFLESGRVVISDFGIFCVAKLCDTGKKRSNYLSIPHGWLYYLAPELIRSLRVATSLHDDDIHLPFTFASDVFSYGTILYELVTGNWPFSDQTSESLIWQLGTGLLAPFIATTSYSSNQLKPVRALTYNHCWSFQPQLRLSFGQISKILEGSKQADPHSQTPILGNVTSNVNHNNTTGMKTQNLSYYHSMHCNNNNNSMNGNTGNFNGNGLIKFNHQHLSPFFTNYSLHHTPYRSLESIF